MFKKTYLSRAMTKAMSLDHPIGDPTGGAAYGEKNDPISVVVAVAGEALFGAALAETVGTVAAGAIIGAGTAAVTGHDILTGAISGGIGAGVADAIGSAINADGTITQVFDDGSTLVTNSATGMPISGTDINGAAFNYSGGQAVYTDGTPVTNATVGPTEPNITQTFDDGSTLITKPDGTILSGTDITGQALVPTGSISLSDPNFQQLINNGANVGDVLNLHNQGFEVSTINTLNNQGFDPSAINALRDQGFGADAIQQFGNMNYTLQDIDMLKNLGLTDQQIINSANSAIEPNTIKAYTDMGYNTQDVVSTLNRGGNLNDLTPATTTATPIPTAPQYTPTPQAGSIDAAFARTNWSDLQPRTLPSGETVYYSPSAYGGNGGTVSFTADGVPQVHAWSGDPAVTSGAQAGYTYTPPQTTVPTTTVPPTSDLSQVAPGVTPIAPVEPVVTPVPEPVITTQPIVEPTPVAPAPVESVAQTTVPTTTVPPTSDLSQVAPGVSTEVVPPTTVSPEVVAPVTPTPTPTPTPDTTTVTYDDGSTLTFNNQTGQPISGTDTSGATFTAPTTGPATYDQTGTTLGGAPQQNFGGELPPAPTQNTTQVYDDGSSMTYNTSTGQPISGTDTSGQTFTVDPSTGTATYDATGAQLGGTPQTNFGGNLASQTDVQNLTNTNASNATTTPSIKDIATVAVAANALSGALTTPPTPTSPYAGQTFTPTAPGEQWSGKLVNANMLPSYVGRAAQVPFYNTTSPVQSQYYWGTHPYVPLGGDMTQYNTIPEAPITPWGIQHGWFETPATTPATAVYGPNMTPIAGVR